MQKFKIIFFILICILASCDKRCKDIVNTAPEQLPSSLQNQIYGLLYYNTWILTNVQGDTIMIEAPQNYQEKVLISSGPRGDNCVEGYEGKRQFFYINSKTKQLFFEINIYATDGNYFNVDPFFEFNAQDHLPLDNSGSMFKDSVSIKGFTFYDVFIMEQDYPLESSPGWIIFNAQKGFIAADGGNSAIFILDSLF